MPGKSHCFPDFFFYILDSQLRKWLPPQRAGDTKSAGEVFFKSKMLIQKSPPSFCFHFSRVYSRIFASGAVVTLKLLPFPLRRIICLSWWHMTGFFGGMITSFSLKTALFCFPALLWRNGCYLWEQTMPWQGCQWTASHRLGAHSWLLHLQGGELKFLRMDLWAWLGHPEAALPEVTLVLIKHTGGQETECQSFPISCVRLD